MKPAMSACLAFCVLALGCAVDPAPGSNRCASDGSCPSGLRCYRPTGLGGAEPGFCVGLDGMDGGADACVSSGSETCNGADDDCDGAVDEGFGGVSEACNSADDDCDGFVDEEILGTSDNCSACGVGCEAPDPDCGPDGSGGFVCGSGCGYSMCPSGCVDTATNRDHCGACAHACDDREDCVAGSCTCAAVGPDCDGTTVSTCCGISCVDLNTSNSHCGGCNLACPTGATCTAQQCQCGSTADCRAPSRCVLGTCV